MKIQDTESGCRLWVKATPKSHRNQYLGWEADFLKIKIHATPSKGSANEELIEFLSTSLSIPKSRISICKGHTARLKQIQLEGFSAKLIEEKLEKIL